MVNGAEPIRRRLSASSFPYRLSVWKLGKLGMAKQRESPHAIPTFPHHAHQLTLTFPRHLGREETDTIPMVFSTFRALKR